MQFNNFLNLNEVFDPDSAYAFQEVADKGLYQTYTFTDDKNQNYQVMFTNIAILGKRVQTIRIGQQVPGGKYYKPLIRKISNPYALVATLLKIFEFHIYQSAKGKLKTGFAFGIPDSAFGAYSAMVTRIMTRMLRAKWDSFDSAYKVPDDQYTKDLKFVYLALKTKPIKDVFNGPEGANLLAGGAPAQPVQNATAQTPVQAPQTTPVAQAPVAPAAKAPVVAPAPVAPPAPTVPQGEGPEFFRAYAAAKSENERDAVAKLYGVAVPNISAIFAWLYDPAGIGENRVGNFSPTWATLGMGSVIQAKNQTAAAPTWYARALNYYLFHGKGFINVADVRAMHDAKVQDIAAPFAGAFDINVSGKALYERVSLYLSNNYSVYLLKKIHTSTTFDQVVAIALEASELINKLSALLGQSDSLYFLGKLADGITNNVTINRDSWKGLFFLSVLATKSEVHGISVTNPESVFIVLPDTRYFTKLETSYGDTVKFANWVMTFFTDNKAHAQVQAWIDAAGVYKDVLAINTSQSSSVAQSKLDDNAMAIFLKDWPTYGSTINAQLEPYREAYKTADVDHIKDYFLKHVDFNTGSNYVETSVIKVFRRINQIKEPPLALQQGFARAVMENPDAGENAFIGVAIVIGNIEDSAQFFAENTPQESVKKFIRKMINWVFNYRAKGSWTSSINSVENAVRQLSKAINTDPQEMWVEELSSIVENDYSAREGQTVLQLLPSGYDQMYPSSLKTALLNMAANKEIRTNTGTRILEVATLKTVGRDAVMQIILQFMNEGSGTLTLAFTKAINANLDETEFVVQSFHNIVDRMGGLDKFDRANALHDLVGGATGVGRYSSIFTDNAAYEKFGLLSHALKSDPTLIAKMKSAVEGVSNKSSLLISAVTGDHVVIEELVEKEPSKLMSAYALDNIGYLEDNLARMVDFDISNQARAKLMVYMLANMEKEYGYNKRTKNGREIAEKICNALSELYETDNASVDVVYTNLDVDTKKSVALAVAKTSFLRHSLGMIFGDSVPIKPYGKLTNARIKQMLKYNEIESPTPPQTIGVKASKTLGDVVAFAKSKASNLDIPDLKVKHIERTSEELEDLSYEYEVYNKYRHGGIALKIIRTFDVTFPGAQERQDAFYAARPGTEIIKPAFHGTGSVAASMILRKGFTVIKSTDPSVVGRMLGDGVYFSTVIDKVAQYVSDGGYQRGIGTKGYIFEMTVAIGKKYEDYKSAGLGNDSIRSPEWAVYHWNDQIVIVRAFEVELITKKNMELLKQRVEARRGIKANESAVQITQFPLLLREASQGSKMNGATTYIFMDGDIPIDKNRSVDFDKFDPKQFGDHVRIETSASGPMVVIDSDKTETFCVRWTKDFMRDSAKLDKFLSLLSGR